MRFAYHATMCKPEFYLPLAVAAEEAGFHTFTVPDSICYPEESSSEYPYNGTGDREFLASVPFLEPFSVIPAMGAEAFTVDGVRRLEDLGIDEAIIAFRNPYLAQPDTQTLEEKIGEIHGFADAVIRYC